MGSNEVTCPVSGCGYTGPAASVAGHVSGKKDDKHDWGALGYNGANHYKRVQNEKNNETEPATLGWLTDSHIGKTTGGYGKTTWKIQPEEDLANIVSTLDVLDLDAVVHTGDLFHNDRHGISSTQLRRVTSLFEQFQNEGTPILYILGNHAREDGEEAWNSLAVDSEVVHLSTTPYEIGNAAIYGVDFQPTKWWKQNTPRLRPSDTDYKILCLHQSVSPYRSKAASEIDLRQTLSEMSQFIDGLPDMVLLGHLHEVIEDQLSINGHTVSVRNYGATTKLGAKRDSFEPGCALITTEYSSGNYIRLSGE